MSCIINKGRYALPCMPTGGSVEVYIGTFSKENKYTYSTDGTKITAVAEGTPTLYSFAHWDQQIGLNQTSQHGDLAVGFQTTLSIMGFDLTSDELVNWKTLLKAPLFAIVKGTNGLYYMAGAVNAGRATESNGGLGVLNTDTNGFTMTITWNSADGMVLVDEAIINAVGGITLVDSI